MSFMEVKIISECFLKPNNEVSETQKPYHLSPFDLPKLTSHYIQKGLLFTKPTQDEDDDGGDSNTKIYSTSLILEHLKRGLTLALVHFYPLAGQLVTQLDEHKSGTVIFVDCNKGPGVKFIHASLATSISSIMSSIDVPLVVQSFFDHHKALCYDGHRRPLLSVQVTELVDGLFIGCSANHAVVDGTTYWRFWNMWSQIVMAKGVDQVSKPRLSIYERWFPNGCGLNHPVLLPFTRPDEFISALTPPKLRKRMFHFSSETVKSLKTKANEQINGDKMIKISSFQALSALVWRSIIRANSLGSDQITTCRLAANNRQRLHPPLPAENFGNCVSLLKTTTTVAQLLDNSLGWAATLLHQSIQNHSNKLIRESLQEWLQSPSIPQHGVLYNSNNILISSSPRFDMYGNEFGLGKAVAVCSGYANNFQGKVTAYPGSEGEASIDLEICLPPHIMSVLESDIDFMAAVSLQ